MTEYSDALPKILFVDDEEDNLLVFRSSFRRNFEIMTANSAAQGLKILESFTPDIIVSDQRMPQLNGVEFLSNLPEEPINIRMILSGYSDADSLIDAINKGKIYQYLKKPWEKNELLQILKDALEVLRQRRNPTPDVQTAPPIQHGSAAAVAPDHKQLERQVDEANRNVQMLSRIGQDIFSNLTVNNIVDSAYENINSLMDASVFAIGIYEEEGNFLNYSVMEKGKKFEEIRTSIHTENQPGPWTFKNKKEIFTNNWTEDYTRYFSGETSAIQGENTLSLIYLPLLIHEKIVGVISVQSFQENAYNINHLNILRNIAIFIATALENSNAYHLIEEQKNLIEHKNIELENKVELRTEELQAKNLELESTHRNIKLLSQIGQQITSTLSLDQIIERVYENVNNLMDATIFGIGIYNPENNSLDYSGSMEKGEKLPFWSASLNAENKIAVVCFRGAKEIVINDFQQESGKYIKAIAKASEGETPESLIYLPLMSGSGPIGVITVQSFKKYIYNPYHIDILRTLGSYITIGIQNSISYTKMTQAFGELKSAQTKLVESEKMASLGVLTAGVAHEINNPVNFISGGIESLNENFTDLKQLLEQIMHPDAQAAGQLWEKLQQKQKKIDLEALISEMDMLIHTIRNGAVRTSEIVKGLRNFTRLDESEMKRTSLEEGINNTLAILNNKLKDRIEVIRYFDEVPDILCYPGQLNQVFMNILGNAADAIEGNGIIRIGIRQEAEMIIINISDTGNGIPPEVLSHIFEPFYTTKEVGKGTGLGLSISYGIIEKHNGKIEVKSELGVGTEFTISLPL